MLHKEIRSEGLSDSSEQLSLVADLGDRFRRDEPLSKHSSLRIGGPATYWAEVETLEELRRVFDVAREADLPWFVVGLGSNTLFPDAGIDGVVIRLVGDFAEWQVEPVSENEAHVHVGAGVVNAHLVRGLHRNGWVGMEFLALIPGTFGGAVALNAGTREKELSSIFRHAKIVTSDEPRMVNMLEPDDIKMAYRHAELPEGAIVVEGTIAVEKGDVDAAARHVKDDKDRRNETQPYRLASVGSTFANPEGDYAGRLIDAAGLKGHSVGGARISPLHANFFINEDGATARDFLRLMATARLRVRQKFGVELRPEVRFVGFDGRSELRAFERELEEQGC